MTMTAERRLRHADIRLPMSGLREKVHPEHEHLGTHGKAKVACPKCKGRKVKQMISLFTAKTSRKS